MPFVKGKCPVCGCIISVPGDQEQCYCSSCGQQVLTSAAMAFAEGDNFGEASCQVAGTGEAAEAKSPLTDEELVAEITGKSVASTAPVSAATQDVSTTPFLDNWKTSVGMFILGLLLSAGLTGVAGWMERAAVYSNTATVWSSQIAGIGISIAYLIVIFVYALWIYPSLFTEKPRMKSSLACTFMNSFCGGLIFGALWCTCLTKKRRGVSQYVLAALLAIELTAVFLVSFGALPGISPSAIDSTSRSSLSNANTSSTAGQSTQSSETGSQESDITDRLYTHPEEFVNTSGAKKIAKTKRGGASQNVDPILGKITFGYSNYDGDLWSVTSGTDSIEKDVGTEVIGLAFLQMLNGDGDAAGEAIKHYIENAKSKPLSAFPLDDGSEGYKGTMVSTGGFNVGGDTYYLNLMYFYEGSEIVQYTFISISKKPGYDL